MSELNAQNSKTYNNNINIDNISTTNNANKTNKLSELNAQNSKSNSDNNNVNKASIETNPKKENERKRKLNVQNGTMAKHLKNNYYAILDNDKECNQEYLEKFVKHVQKDQEEPTTSKNSPSKTKTKKYLQSIYLMWNQMN